MTDVPYESKLKDKVISRRRNQYKSIELEEENTKKRIRYHNDGSKSIKDRYGSPPRWRRKDHPQGDTIMPNASYNNKAMTMRTNAQGDTIMPNATKFEIGRSNNMMTYKPSKATIKRTQIITQARKNAREAILTNRRGREVIKTIVTGLNCSFGEELYTDESFTNRYEFEVPSNVKIITVSSSKSDYPIPTTVPLFEIVKSWDEERLEQLFDVSNKGERIRNEVESTYKDKYKMYNTHLQLFSSLNEDVFCPDILFDFSAKTYRIGEPIIHQHENEAQKYQSSSSTWAKTITTTRTPPLDTKMQGFFVQRKLPLEEPTELHIQPIHIPTNSDMKRQLCARVKTKNPYDDCSDFAPFWINLQQTNSTATNVDPTNLAIPTKFQGLADQYYTRQYAGRKFLLSQLIKDMCTNKSQNYYFIIQSPRIPRSIQDYSQPEPSVSDKNQFKIRSRGFAAPPKNLVYGLHCHGSELHNTERTERVEFELPRNVSVLMIAKSQCNLYVDKSTYPFFYIIKQWPHTDLLELFKETTRGKHLRNRLNFMFDGNYTNHAVSLYTRGNRLTCPEILLDFRSTTYSIAYQQMTDLIKRGGQYKNIYTNNVQQRMQRINTLEAKEHQLSLQLKHANALKRQQILDLKQQQLNEMKALIREEIEEVKHWIESRPNRSRSDEQQLHLIDNLLGFKHQESWTNLDNIQSPASEIQCVVVSRNLPQEIRIDPSFPSYKPPTSSSDDFPPKYLKPYLDTVQTLFYSGEVKLLSQYIHEVCVDPNHHYYLILNTCRGVQTIDEGSTKIYNDLVKHYKVLGQAVKFKQNP